MMLTVANACGVVAGVRRLADRYEWRGTLRRRRGPSLLILPYHRVGPAADDLLMPPLHPDTFAMQVEHLIRRYRVLPLADALDRLFAGTLPPRATAITFDDGYRDNQRFALPILERFGAPATIFLATDFIGTGQVPPHDQAALAIRYATVRSASIPVGGGSIDLRLDNDDARRAAIQTLTARLRAAGRDEAKQILSLVNERLRSTVPVRSERAMLDWDDVRSMGGGLVTFGSHGESHTACAALDKGELRSEFERSKRLIEEVTGTPARVYAYPFGKPADVGPDARDALTAAGYAYAVTTQNRVAASTDDAFAVPRGGPVWADRPAAFAARVAVCRLRGR